MPGPLEFEILPQPDDSTCGPTSLHAVYRYFGDDVSLDQVILESPQLEEGGTLAVLLGCHALRRGYRATIYTFDLNVLDPTWFHGKHTRREPQPPGELRGDLRVDVVEKLRAQMKVKSSSKLTTASRAYIDFARLGGRLRMVDLTAGLIRKYLKRSVPIISGLSATYLQHCPREFGPRQASDDVRGVPQGHFVVLFGYDKEHQAVHVADPYPHDPEGEEHYYEVGFDRLVSAILLGVLTYDANLLIVEPHAR